MLAQFVRRRVGRAVLGTCSPNMKRPRLQDATPSTYMLHALKCGRQERVYCAPGLITEDHLLGLFRFGVVTGVNGSGVGHGVDGHDSRVAIMQSCA